MTDLVFILRLLPNLGEHKDQQAFKVISFVKKITNKIELKNRRDGGYDVSRHTH